MKPKHLFFASIFIWMLPLLKLWVEQFMEHPFGVASITYTVLLVISVIWAFIIPEKKVEKDKYRIEVVKYWLPQSWDAIHECHTAYEYKYTILIDDHIIKVYDNVEEAYKQLEFLNKNIK